jgi:hypothetical protein
MALTITPASGEGGIMKTKMHTLEKRVHVTLDGSKVAGEKDTLTKLLGGPGAQIPMEQAIALGLAKATEAAPAEPAPAAEVKEEAPAEDKGSAPAEDKSAAPAESKGKKKR